MKMSVSFIIGCMLVPAVLLPVRAEDEMPLSDDDIVEILTATSDLSDIGDPTTAMILLDDGLSNTLFYHPLAQEMIDFAATHLGRPYRRGGKGPSVFDCSGFTSYVYRKFGYSLSPSSSMQYTQGEPVDIKFVRPGDLLFFSGRSISASRVGHVGMVVDVDEEAGIVRFIHAAVGGGIRYDSYPDNPYYQKRYIGARRVLESDVSELEE